MARLRFSVIILACAGVSAAGPAAAQFNPLEAIFGPFRPPADIPGRSPPPSQYPPSTRLPPGPPPSQQYPQQQYPQQYPPSARLPPGPPPGVQTQPLPPPPGATSAPPGQGALPRPVQPRPSRPAGPPEPPSGEIVTPTAQKIANPTAVFSGLDKITGRIITFDVAINETVQFGALQVTPRVCYTRPPSETANTDSFIEVDEVTLQGEVRRVFTGWMFAASPGLNAVEHPIYDVWLSDCKGGTTVIAETPPDAAQPAPAQQRPPPRQQRPRQVPPAETPFPPVVR
jgi:hypothetical protein